MNESRKVVIPFGSSATTASFQTDSILSPKCSAANYFRASQKSMSLFGLGPFMSYWEPVVLCVNYCNGDALALLSRDPFKAPKVFPNPVTGDKAMLKDLSESTTLTLYDLLGRQVYSSESNKESATIDHAGMESVVYLQRITDSNGNQDVLKLVKSVE